MLLSGDGQRRRRRDIPEVPEPVRQPVGWEGAGPRRFVSHDVLNNILNEQYRRPLSPLLQYEPPEALYSNLNLGPRPPVGPPPLEVLLRLLHGMEVPRMPERPTIA